MHFLIITVTCDVLINKINCLPFIIRHGALATTLDMSYDELPLTFKANFVFVLLNFF